MPLVHRLRPLPFSIQVLLGISVGFFSALVYEFFIRSQAPVPGEHNSSNLVPFGPPTLLEAVNSTIVLHPAMRGTLADYKCGQIFEVIRDSINQFDFIRESLELAVNRGLIIVCEPKDVPKEHHSNKSYQPDTNTIHMAPGTIDVNAEIFGNAIASFLADLRHSTPQCLMADSVAMFPLYVNLTPVALENTITRYGIEEESRVLLEDLTRSLEQGDKRIQHYKDMWKISKGGKKENSLTPEEEEIFKKYKNASKGSVPVNFVFYSVVEKEVYDGFKERKFEIFFDVDDEYVFDKRLVQLEYDDNGKYRLYYRLLNPEVNIFDIVGGIPKMLDRRYGSDFYLEKLMERVDTTFRILSLSARTAFYPETMILMRKEQERCPLPEPGYRNAPVVS